MQMAEYLRRRDTFIETEVSLVFWEHLKTGEPISEQQCDLGSDASRRSGGGCVTRDRG